jgi:hypothetical protein
MSLYIYGKIKKEWDISKLFKEKFHNTEIIINENENDYDVEIKIDEIILPVALKLAERLCKDVMFIQRMEWIINRKLNKG